MACGSCCCEGCGSSRVGAEMHAAHSILAKAPGWEACCETGEGALNGAEGKLLRMGCSW